MNVDYKFAVVVVQSPGCVQLFATPCTSALQAPLSFSISQSLLTFESVMLSDHLTLCCPCVHAELFIRVRLFATPWTAARQAPLSMGFSLQEYWSGLTCPPPGDLRNPGIEPRSYTLLNVNFLIQ